MEKYYVVYTFKYVAGDYSGKREVFVEVAEGEDSLEKARDLLKEVLDDIKASPDSKLVDADLNNVNFEMHDDRFKGKHEVISVCRAMIWGEDQFTKYKELFE